MIFTTMPAKQNHHPLTIYTLTLLLLTTASCDPYSARGIVKNLEGEPLPGVVVSDKDNEHQIVTDPLGNYKLPAHLGQLQLHFAKTGFTSGSLTTTIKLPGTTDVGTISLWRLPQSSGLYFLEECQYRKATQIEPLPFLTTDKTPLYGIRTTPIEKTTPHPILICYEMPLYDTKLVRLKQIKAAPIENTTTEADVWISDQIIETNIAPIDEPDRKLYEINLIGDLQPGIYTLHWGSLDGHKETDSRAYLFEVPAPPENQSKDQPTATPEKAAPTQPNTTENTPPQSATEQPQKKKKHKTPHKKDQETTTPANNQSPS